MSMTELIDRLTELVKEQADIIKEQSYIIAQHGIETEPGARAAGSAGTEKDEKERG